MSGKYYIIDFVAKTGGSIRVKARNKKDALAAAIHEDFQIESILSDLKPYDLDVELVKDSVQEDEDQDPSPWESDWD